MRVIIERKPPGERREARSEKRKIGEVVDVRGGRPGEFTIDDWEKKAIRCQRSGVSIMAAVGG